MQSTKKSTLKTKATVLPSSPEINWVFPPENFIRFLWDLLVLSLVLYLSISVPYILAFKESDSLPSALDYLITSIFILDVFVNLNTGVFIRGLLSLSRKDIIKDYLKFWFWIDIISAIPIDLIIESTFSSSYLKTLRLVKIIRIFKLLKLIKLSKLKYTISKIEDRIASKSLITFILIMKLQIYIFLFAHMIGCLMFLISNESLEPRSFANLLVNKAEDAISDTREIYLSALYWAYTTMVSLGYGDLYPISINEKVFGIFCLLMSSLSNGLIIGNIGTIIMKNTAFSRKRRESIRNLNNYASYHKLSDELRHKIRMYAEFTFNEKKQEEIDLHDLLSLLSEPLREEIYVNLNGDELYTFPIFNKYPTVLAHKLSRVMHSEIYAPEDDILNESAVPVGIYFLQSGSVEVYIRKSRMIIKVLSNGDHFGEIGFFTRQPCCASVKAKDYCELVMISCADFDKTLKLLPSAMKVNDEIKESFKDGNLTILGIKCYLCKKLGHIAKKCTFFKKIVEKHKKFWLKSRNQSKMIDIRKYKKYYKIRKTPVDQQYGIKNVKGIKDWPENLYRGNNRLIEAVTGFKRTDDSDDNLDVFCRDFELDKRSSYISLIVDDSDQEDVTIDNFNSTNLDI